MKITDLRVFHTSGGHANWIFVKLYTDEGITGVGESTMERHDAVIIQALESFKDFLIGQDAHQIPARSGLLHSQAGGTFPSC